MPLNDFRSICLPYCLQKQKDGKYIALNREYEPLGFNAKDRVDYGAYPIATKYMGLTAAKIAKISYKGDSDPDAIYLYNDGCVPTAGAEHMKKYLERLAILSKLKRA